MIHGQRNIKELFKGLDGFLEELSPKLKLVLQRQAIRLGSRASSCILELLLCSFGQLGGRLWPHRAYMEWISKRFRAQELPGVCLAGLQLHGR